MSVTTNSTELHRSALANSAKPVRLTAVCSLIVLVEFVAVALAAVAASSFYQSFVVDHHVDLESHIPGALFLAALVSSVSVGFQHFVGIQRQPLHLLLWNGIGAVALAFSFFLTVLFLLKVSTDYSRGVFILQLISVTGVVCIIRTIFYFTMQSAIRGGMVEARHVVLIGDEHHRSHFVDMVQIAGIRSVGALAFPRFKAAAAGEAAELINSKTAGQIIDFCRFVNPDDVVILASQDELAAAPELARMLSELPVNVHIVPLGSINFFGTSRIAELGDLKTLQVSRPPLSSFERAIKRAFDIVVAATALVVLAPLFLIVAVAIKLESKGSVFFWQKRHGYNRTTIGVAKFRTMVTCEDGRHFVQARPGDSRVTHVGRILRRTNIDELPQLFNVLIGNMSIVGPRPHATAHNEMFEGRILPFARRHNIKPGITGWAQVNGHRGETDTLEKMQRRVEHDLYYIDNWSFLLDVKIILLTLFSRRAYVNAY